MHNAVENILHTSAVWLQAIFRYAMPGIGQLPCALQRQKFVDSSTDRQVGTEILGITAV